MCAKLLLVGHGYFGVLAVLYCYSLVPHQKYTARSKLVNHYFQCEWKIWEKAGIMRKNQLDRTHISFLWIFHVTLRKVCLFAISAKPFSAKHMHSLGKAVICCFPLPSLRSILVSNFQNPNNCTFCFHFI